MVAGWHLLCLHTCNGAPLVFFRSLCGCGGMEILRNETCVGCNTCMCAYMFAHVERERKKDIDFECTCFKARVYWGWTPLMLYKFSKIPIFYVTPLVILTYGLLHWKGAYLQVSIFDTERKKTSKLNSYKHLINCANSFFSFFFFSQK